MSQTTYGELFPTDETERAKHEGHPFAPPNLWRTSTFTSTPTSGDTLFQLPFSFSPPLPTTPESLASDSIFHMPADLKLPQLPGLHSNIWPQFGPVVDDEPRSELTTATTDDEGNVFSDVVSEEEEDVWRMPETAVATAKPRFYTWDSFLVDGANAPPNGYISEAGPRVMDAALEEAGDVGTVIRADVFRECLLHLGLGRNSVLFVYDHKKEVFRPVRENLKISGCTAGSIGSIIAAFSECGANIKRLEHFAATAYQDSSPASQSLIALARCTSTIIESIQKRLSTHGSIRSILHLHSLIRDPALIIDSFVVLTAATVGARDDCELLSRLFEKVQQQQHRSGWLKPLLIETLARVSKPWLEFVEQWIGLDEGPGGLGVSELMRERGFIGVEEASELDEVGKDRVVKSFVFNKSQVPSFISAEAAETVFETGRSLRYLERFHPRHPLSVPATVKSDDAPRLHWKFSWQDLEDLQTQAKTYEQNLRSAIHKYTVQQDDTSVFDDIANDPMEVDYTFETFGRSKEQLATNLQESLMAMNRNLPPLDSPTEEDALTAMVMHLTRETTTSITDSHLTAFAPPLSITPLLSFSHILSAQSRLINRACLRMFFKEHNIRPHLQLLRRFQLFGDGVFASRLTHALFDADMDSTERRTGSFRTGGTMGLKLGSRETWPPASSELRLALMNVLTESFSQPTGLHSVGKTGELPGGLSFAVREMSQEELDRCMDPNGISALDFLKLEYRPPAPLEVIITRAAMLRYDTIFRLLLRMLRMLFVVNQLWREEGKRKVSGVRRRFGMEARHFVGALAGYMVESGIGTTWDRFERKLAEVEAQVDREGECSGEEISLDRVRAWHEGVLDRIMFAMLSRKRQLPVMKIVEEIFEVVLKFSVVCGRGEGGEAEAEEVAKLYKMFRRRVGVFISVCRGLSEKRGYGDSGEKRADAALGEGFKEEANLLGMLLLGLEMSGYYSGGAGAGTATTVGSKRRR